MKWRDSGEAEDAKPLKDDAYYADDGYASFKGKGNKRTPILSGNPVRYLYWGLGIAVVVLLVILPFVHLNESGEGKRISDLEQTIQRLEQRLEKYDGVDEKVTRIWEQAKSYETFKTRFDRSEASMSLRMDQLSMSLDALQKKIDEIEKKVDRIAKTAVSTSASTHPPSVDKATAKMHTVGAGDTLYSISRRYGLSVQELRSLNQLTSGSVLSVGQTLRVSPSGD